MALLETPGSTLLDIARMLTDDNFRSQLTAGIENPAVRRYWQNEFTAYTPAFRQEVIGPILNKLGGFAYTPLVRNIMGQRKNLFELRRIMDEGKILIVNLGKGFMGEGTAALFGSMLVTSLMIAAFTRQDIPEDARRPFFLYLDEFHNFATPGTLAALLSETRKFKISVTLSWQYLAQLSDELRGATFGNVGTTISFRVGAEDAEYLARELAPVSPSELTDLDLHHIYVKQTKGGAIFAPISGKTLPPPRPTASYREEIIRRSRQCYARPRALAEQEATGHYLSIPGSTSLLAKTPRHSRRIPPVPGRA